MATRRHHPLNDLVELVQKPRVKTASRLWLHLLRRYFRIEVEGVENIPLSGGAVIVPNHSGFLGADAVLLAFIIKRESRRRARILAHRAYFDVSRRLKSVSESFGLRRASTEAGIKILKQKHLLILFPEGEAGNFKPTSKMYRLQKFHTGFLRIAIEGRAPIVPCLVIGAEESNLNLGSLDFSRFVKGLKIPLPLNLVPLPAKWRIVFLPPLDLSAEGRLGPDILSDSKDLPKLEKYAQRLRREMQRELLIRTRERPYVFTRRTKRIFDRIKKTLK